MEEKLEQAVDDLYRPHWSIVLLWTIHVGYYVYSSQGFHWMLETEYLDRYGALRTDLVDQGQFWRLFASIFLHANLFHLILNMVNLHVLAGLLLRISTVSMVFVVYILSGIASSVCTWSIGTFRTVGASGAIFGLMGFLWIVAWKYRFSLQGRLGNILRKQLAFWGVFSLLIGYIVPMIDNHAHIGGLIMGILLGMIWDLPES